MAAGYRMLKGATDAERLRSADSLLEALDRKVAALEARMAAREEVPRRRDQRLDRLEAMVQELLKHLHLEPRDAQKIVELLPAGDGEEEG